MDNKRSEITEEDKEEEVLSQNDLLKNKDDKSNNLKKEFSNWIVTADGDTYMYKEDGVNLAKNVEPNIYSLENDQEGNLYLLKEQLKSDDLYRLPIRPIYEMLKDTENFWNSFDKFDKYGIVKKRGFLLHGPPGCGKSCAIKIIVSKIVEEYKGIVIFLKTQLKDVRNFQRFMRAIRKTQPNTPVFVVVEDIDQMDRDAETEFTHVLDGNYQFEKVQYIATTNYPEDLKDRLIKRPNRFDRRYYFGYPDKKVREFYLRTILKDEDLHGDNAINISKWIEETETKDDNIGLSFGSLSELVTSVLVLNNSLEETISHLKNMTSGLDSQDYSKNNDGKERNNLGYNSKKNKENEYKTNNNKSLEQLKREIAEENNIDYDDFIDKIETKNLNYNIKSVYVNDDNKFSDVEYDVE